MIDYRIISFKKYDAEGTPMLRYQLQKLTSYLQDLWEDVGPHSDVLSEIALIKRNLDSRNDYTVVDTNESISKSAIGDLENLFRAS